MSHSSSPPRLLVRTFAATFLTSAVVLGIVFVVSTLAVERSVHRSVAQTLTAVHQVFSANEDRRTAEQLAAVSALAERPTLKAALDTYQSELSWGRPSPDLLATIQRETDRLASRVDAELVVVLDPQGTTLGSSGALSGRLMPEGFAPSSGTKLRGGARLLRTIDGIANVLLVPLEVNAAQIGWLVVGEHLERAFADRLAELAGSRIAVIAGADLWASTLPPSAEVALRHAWSNTPPEEGAVALDGESWAYRRILDAGDAAVYVFGSIDALTAQDTREARASLMRLAALALLLSAGASTWLARSISRPINELSSAVQSMTADRNLATRLKATGSSRELDGFSNSFNHLMEALAASESETRSTTVSAIRGLAAALDARDPYTAGHSDRVSLLSVGMARRLALSASDIEILRVGALLHDIGKIGVPDAVLQKPGSLTDEEFAIIKTHPTLGARILRTISFLANHVPIVELHHERPDGRGYPHGLSGTEIPVFASIVHVADAYDAMTTDRAYRDARSASEAVAELWRCAGSDFDVDAVRALVAVLTEVRLPEGPTPTMQLRLVASGATSSDAGQREERAG